VPHTEQLGGTACVLFKPPVLLNVMLEWWRRYPEQMDAAAPGQVRARADPETAGLLVTIGIRSAS